MLALLLRVIELGLDVLCQTLAQLNTPLVEAVDIPNRTLGEGQVLVVCDQRTKRTWSDLLRKDAGRRSVTHEGLVRNESLGGGLSLELVRGLSNHKSFGLGEEVRCKHALMLVVVNWVVRLRGQDEVGRNELRALVEQLVEGVLGVGGRFSEEDRTSGVFDGLTITSNALSVRLHRQLLEVGWETVEVLVESDGFHCELEVRRIGAKSLTEKPSESEHRRSQSTRRSTDQQ